MSIDGARVPPRLILVRHGQASLGTDDYDRLSETGHRQAALTAERLAAEMTPETALWTGTLRRHRETSEPIVGEARGPLTTTADLNEFSTYGLVRAALREAETLGISVPPREQLLDPARHLPDLLAWFPEVLTAWQERGMVDEQIGSWEGFRKRVLRPRSLWEDAAGSGRDIVVVSSAGVIATLAAALAERSLDWQRELAVRLYNASVTELAYRDSGWELTRCNCVEHLELDGLQTLA